MLIVGTIQKNKKEKSGPRSWFLKALLPKELLAKTPKRGLSVSKQKGGESTSSRSSRILRGGELINKGRLQLIKKPFLKSRRGTTYQAPVLRHVAEIKNPATVREAPEPVKETCQKKPREGGARTKGRKNRKN